LFQANLPVTPASKRWHDKVINNKKSFKL